MSSSDHNLWAMLALQDRLFAIPALSVQTITIAPAVTKVPTLPGHVRGVMNLRGQIIPLIDLRERLGMTSLNSEAIAFCDMMHQREQDHKNWINELQASVTEQREFKLTTDPHKCAFGKWYDTFKTDNVTISAILARFEAPHQRIHAIGEQVKSMAAKGEHSAASALIDRCRDTELSEMIHLFGTLREAYTDCAREIAVVVNHNDLLLAFAVDAIDSISELATGSTVSLDEAGAGLTSTEFVASVGRTKGNDRFVLILDLNKLLG